MAVHGCVTSTAKLVSGKDLYSKRQQQIAEDAHRDFLTVSPTSSLTYPFREDIDYVLKILFLLITFQAVVSIIVVHWSRGAF